MCPRKRNRNAGQRGSLPVPAPAPVLQLRSPKTVKNLELQELQDAPQGLRIAAKLRPSYTLLPVIGQGPRQWGGTPQGVTDRKLFRKPGCAGQIRAGTGRGTGSLVLWL